MKHMLLRFSPGFSCSFLSLVLLFTFTTPFFAQDTSAEAARQRTLMAERYTTERLWVWQKRLNLLDWNISVAVSRASELKPKTLGNIHWDTNLKQANIGVLSAYDYTLPTPQMLDDMEFTIVHELVHLHLASLPRNEASRRTEERAVNELAAALLRLAKH